MYESCKGDFVLVSGVRFIQGWFRVGFGCRIYSGVVSFWSRMEDLFRGGSSDGLGIDVGSTSGEPQHSASISSVAVA